MFLTKKKIISTVQAAVIFCLIKVAGADCRCLDALDHPQKYSENVTEIFVRLAEGIQALAQSVNEVNSRLTSSNQPRDGRRLLMAGDVDISIEERVEELERRLLRDEGSGEEVFFSLATSKLFRCSDCIISYDRVHANSHAEFMRPETGTFFAPYTGYYFFQFHGLVEAHRVAKVQFVLNGTPVIHMYDSDMDGNNNRFAMIGQSIIHRLESGDWMQVRLHEGALKGGGSHAFTTWVGQSVGKAKTGHHSLSSTSGPQGKTRNEI